MNVLLEQAAESRPLRAKNFARSGVFPQTAFWYPILRKVHSQKAPDGLDQSRTLAFQKLRPRRSLKGLSKRICSFVGVVN